MVRAYESPNCLKIWPPHEKVKRWLRRSVFSNYVPDEVLEVRKSHHILAAIARTYVPDGGYFRLGEQRIVITLSDIFHITGLPIDGAPVICEAFNRDIAIGCFGEERGDALMNEKTQGRIEKRWFRENFGNVPDEVDENNNASVGPYVRAYLCNILGAVLFPDKDGKYIPLIYLSLIVNLDNINNYAWGAGVLAHLHASLKLFQASPKKTQFDGAVTVLLIAFFERIRTIRQAEVLKLPSPPLEFPLFWGWVRNMSCPLKNTQRIPLVNWDELLQQVEESDIKWNPYSRLTGRIPPEQEGQLRIARSRTVLIFLNEVVYHRPDLCPREFGFTTVDEDRLRNLIELNPKKKKVYSDDLLHDRAYEPYLLEWGMRESSMVVERVEPHMEREETSRMECGESSMMFNEDVAETAESPNDEPHQVVETVEPPNDEPHQGDEPDDEPDGEPHEGGGRRRRRRRRRRRNEVLLHRRIIRVNEGEPRDEVVETGEPLNDEPHDDGEPDEGGGRRRRTEVQMLGGEVLQHRRNIRKAVCMQCGDEGCTDAFEYCVKCRDFVVHRYCLDVIPKTLDEEVHWVCDECEEKWEDESLILKDEVIPCETRDSEGPVEVVRTGEQVYEVRSSEKRKTVSSSDQSTIYRGPKACTSQPPLHQFHFKAPLHQFQQPLHQFQLPLHMKMLPKSDVRSYTVELEFYTSKNRM